MIKFKQKNKAFTLAEVLVTLTIIGIVAAMTIPAIKKKQEEISTISGLKKAYATLQSAYSSAMEKYGTSDTWSGNATIYLDNLAPYMKLSQKCGLSTGCWSTTIAYRNLANNNPDIIGLDTTYYAKAKMSDGMLLAFYKYASPPSVGTNWTLGSAYSSITVDVNGFKPPNKFGRDTYVFYLTKNAVVPAGIPADTGMPAETRCLNKNVDGLGCAGWVIYAENMDYLKCPGSLSWAGNHKCP